MLRKDILFGIKPISTCLAFLAIKSSILVTPELRDGTDILHFFNLKKRRGTDCFRQFTFLVYAYEILGACTEQTLKEDVIHLTRTL